MARGHAFAIMTASCTAAAACSGCVPSGTGWAAPYLEDQSPKIAVVMPARAPSISQEFRYNENIAGHEGIDILAPVRTPVIAAADGVVRNSLFEPMYGNRLVIDHGSDAAGRRIVTVYKHLKARIANPGSHVQRGETIALSGNTGALAGGIPHLHFEVHRQAHSQSAGMSPIDPHLVWANGAGRVSCYTPHAQEQPQSDALTYPLACGPLRTPS
ncbi:M23 family metallopeptidase [Pseudohoeflea suaedae]|nr:M23 family metallopeptidase [Pseudohoeflea suaedae]